MRPRSGGRWSYTIIEKGGMMIVKGGRVVGREKWKFGRVYWRRRRKGKGK